ncbi:TetR/AcrR family transcriptional regulator [Clostridiaceae bacterium HSG29]|nr:TetR/AcrR family transcriptional regulator [Clostridiaceae bacterium HSG29]
MIKNQNSKKEKIYEAVLLSVAQYGLNVPMSKIVSESGISTGVFYHYFSNKESMISELYKKMKYDFLEATLSDINEDYKYYEQFGIIWINSVNYFIDNPNALKLFKQFENAPHLVPQLENYHLEKINIFVKFIKDGIDKGIVKDLPLILLSDLTIGVSMQVAKNAISKTIVLDDDMKEKILNACWDSIKTN